MAGLGWRPLKSYAPEILGKCGAGGVTTRFVALWSLTAVLEPDQSEQRVSTGIDARASRDAGSYLCNYLSWRAIEATHGSGGPRLAAFVHVPLLTRGGVSQRKDMGHRITLEQLVDAGEAMLLEMVRLTRSAVRNSASSH